MITHHLGDEEVRAYLRDLVRRIRSCDPIPSIWCPLTDSGLTLLRPMIGILRKDAPELIPLIGVLGMAVENDGALRFAGGNPNMDLPGKHVLLLDASVHSGETMLKAQRKLWEHGAAGVCSYALVLKRGSRFIPSIWGVMIGDHDRAYFQMELAPNNRLTTHSNERHPFSHMRQLSAADIGAPPLLAGVASLDRATWGDRYYDMHESDGLKRTYLLEARPGIVGYLTVRFGDCLHVDEVAVDREYRGQGYGGVLLRFADTLARHSDCRAVQLNAISDRVRWYESFGYEVLSGRKTIRVEAETYVPMERQLLHHLSPGDT